MVLRFHRKIWPETSHNNIFSSVLLYIEDSSLLTTNIRGINMDDTTEDLNALSLDSEEGPNCQI